MKKLYYIFSLLTLIMLIGGCIKDNSNNVVLPTGNFAGTFTRVHLSPYNHNKLDTIKANLNISMSAATGYVVTGDTSKHAGSHGSYVVDGVNILFTDATLPTTLTTPPAKVHLSGLYQYSFGAPNLQITFSNDTLAIVYNLTAQ